jgi:hypothetical protein
VRRGGETRGDGPAGVVVCLLVGAHVGGFVRGGSLERCLSGVLCCGCGRVLNVLELMLFFTALLDMVIYTSRTTSVRHDALAPQPRNFLVGRLGG